MANIRIIFIFTILSKISGIGPHFFRYPANPVSGRIVKITIRCTPTYLCITIWIVERHRQFCLDFRHTKSAISVTTTIFSLSKYAYFVLKFMVDLYLTYLTRGGLSSALKKYFWRDSSPFRAIECDRVCTHIYS